MDLYQAEEMAEALISDNEQSIHTLGEYGDEVAELLIERIRALEDKLHEARHG